MQSRTMALPLVLSLLFAAPLTAQSISLETLLSSPFPSGLTASPEGDAVAWVQNDEGVRNIWLATAPEWRGRMLTRYAEDDGQEIGGLAWTPDGRRLLFVRGGAPNRAGEAPNPTHNPAGAERALFRIGIDGGEPVNLGAGNSHVVSPGGDRVALVRSGQIWSVPLDSGTATALASVRGGISSLSWSPDGSKLAFRSGRSTHALIGVYDDASKTVRFLDASLDSDQSPVWSPDGNRIA
jgi:Tol biopolymer transport system component